MTCAQFAGFNGFEQFGPVEILGDTFRECVLSSSRELRLSSLRVCFAWEYNAIACGHKLILSGCLNGIVHRSKEIDFEHEIKQVAAQEKNCMVLLNDGQLFKLNLQTFAVTSMSSLIMAHKPSTRQSNSKRTITFGKLECPADESSEHFTHIACGRSMTVAITTENNIYNLPLRIATFPKHIKVKQVSCGNEHCLILTTNGDVYAFGSSSRGQLGLDSLDSEEQPTLVDALAGVKIVDIAAGGWHSIAVSAFGDLYAWGWNVNGQMGLPTFTEVVRKYVGNKSETVRRKLPSVFPTPQIIDLPLRENNDDDDPDEQNLDKQHDIVYASAGARHTVLLTRSGVCLGTGWNKYGQLGDTGTEELNQFQALTISKDSDSDRIVVCGDWCTVLIQ